MDGEMPTGRREANSIAVDAQMQRIHEQTGQRAAPDQKRDRERGSSRLHLHRGVQTVARQDRHRGSWQLEDGCLETRGKRMKIIKSIINIDYLD